MAFSKITPQDLKGTGAMSLPDQPTISAQELKRKFDEPAKEVVVPKFNNLIDEIEDSTAAVSLGATAPTGRTVASNTVQAGLNKLSDDLATVEASISTVVAHDHTHDNKEVLDKLDVDSGSLTYDGVKVGEKDYDNLDNRPQINSHTLTGNQSASDLGLMPATTLATVATSGSFNDLSDQPSIPTVTDTYDGTSSDAMSGKAVASAISTKSTVTYSQTYTSAGQKIGEITIDGTKTDVIAPSGGGGGGGGAVDSVNGQTGTVVLDLDDINDTSIANLDDQHTLVYNGTSHTWGNEPLADVALTNSYNDLDNLPTIPTVDQTYSSSSANAQSGVAVASAISGKADTSSLKDLAYIDTDGVGSTKVLQGDGTWVTPSTGGHQMIDNSTLLSSMNTAIAEGTSNDDVVSAYGVGTWSNAYRRTYMVRPTSAHPIGTTGIGTWDDESTHAGWIQIGDLKGISAIEHDVKIVFNPATFTGDVPVLRGYKIEDFASDSTKNYGLITILFANEISSADTEVGEVGVEITIGREPVSYITPS